MKKIQGRMKKLVVTFPSIAPHRVPTFFPFLSQFISRVADFLPMPNGRPKGINFAPHKQKIHVIFITYESLTRWHGICSIGKAKAIIG
jgi:hypothetical protein